MAGKSLQEVLSDVSTTGERLFTAFMTAARDSDNYHTICQQILKHPSVNQLTVMYALQFKKYNFHNELVQVTNKEAVEQVRKNKDIESQVIFGKGSKEIILACKDRFTLADLNALLSNPNARDLTDFVLDKVNALASNDLASLVRLLQDQSFINAMRTPKQREALGKIAENATSMFQGLITSVATQTTEPAE